MLAGATAKDSAKRVRQATYALLGLLLWGCGSSPTREDSLNEAFMRIQVHEANIERNRAALAAGQPGCADRCQHLGALCRERAGICETARAVADADALERCERAGTACDGSRLDVAADCTCAADPH